MDDSTFTVIALTGVVVLFVSGVILIVMGLRGRTDRLPPNADDILAAIDAGLLASEPDRAEPRPRPAYDAAPSVRADTPRDTPPDTPHDERFDDEDDTVTRAFFSREPELNRF